MVCPDTGIQSDIKVSYPKHKRVCERQKNKDIYKKEFTKLSVVSKCITQEAVKPFSKIEPTNPCVVHKLSLFADSAKVKEQKIPGAFICPITMEIMQDPVFCMLDGRTYERSEITTWLNGHRNSPFNREQMAANQTVDMILKPNYALIEAMKEYKATQAELCDKAKPTY